MSVDRPEHAVTFAAQFRRTAPGDVRTPRADPMTFDTSADLLGRILDLALMGAEPDYRYTTST
ncbi:hypothetical protein [Streptomyces sp. NPDC050759]|uniref:hypothetical protein n=1 Tax=Streptomyces sp. NPDC050759 TaxID=3365635 RepID=UPI0037B9AEC7